MTKINSTEIGLCSLLDHLDTCISINHSKIVCCFIKILLEYKRNSSTKIFLPRNAEKIWLHSGSGFQKQFKIRIRSASNPEKITGYPLRIRSVASSG